MTQTYESKCHIKGRDLVVRATPAPEGWRVLVYENDKIASPFYVFIGCDSDAGDVAWKLGLPVDLIATFVEETCHEIEADRVPLIPAA